MRVGERYLREIEVLKAHFEKSRSRAYPSRIKVFGMEYQLVQPIKLEKFRMNDNEPKRSVSK